MRTATTVEGTQWPYATCLCLDDCAHFARHVKWITTIFKTFNVHKHICSARQGNHAGICVCSFQFRLICAKISTKLFRHANECIEHFRVCVCVCGGPAHNLRSLWKNKCLKATWDGRLWSIYRKYTNWTLANLLKWNRVHACVRAIIYLRRVDVVRDQHIVWTASQFFVTSRRA